MTGKYSRLAQAEGTKYCLTNEVVTPSPKNESDSPTLQKGWNIMSGGQYFHYCDNEASSGFEFKEFPFDKVPNDQVLVADMSSSITTKHIEWSRYGVVYAGAQKQIGCEHLYFTAVRNDLIG